MSSNTRINTSNFMVTDYDQTKTFVWNPRTETATYTNGTGSEVTLAEGTLLGRVNASGKVAVLASGSTDGSQYPCGVLMHSVTVADGDDAVLTFAVEGDVVESKLVLDGTDTLSTVVDGRILRDRIAADTVGIKLVGGTQLTGYDN